MNFIFELDQMNKDEALLIPQFCRLLLKNIKTDIRDNISYRKFNRYEKYLLESNLIRWTVDKPDSINVVELCNIIANSFKCYEMKDNSFSIKIDRSVKLRGTKTRIATIARLLDKGNEKVPGTFFISSVLNKYSKNINKFWQVYVSMKLGRVKVSKCIRVT